MIKKPEMFPFTAGRMEEEEEVGHEESSFCGKNLVSFEEEKETNLYRQVGMRKYISPP